MLRIPLSCLGMYSTTLESEISLYSRLHILKKKRVCFDTFLQLDDP